MSGAGRLSEVPTSEVGEGHGSPSVAPHRGGARGRSPRSRRWATYALAGGIRALLIVSSVLWLPHGRGSSNCMVTPQFPIAGTQWYTLAACHSDPSMDSNSYPSPYQILRLTDAETVCGRCPANASINAYLLSTSEAPGPESDSHLTAPPPSYFWTYGTASGCKLSVKVPGSLGQCLIVLESLSLTPVSVEWTKTLALCYDPG